MSVIERFQIMEALWDSLTLEAAEIESPEWHGEVLPVKKDIYRRPNNVKV